MVLLCFGSYFAGSGEIEQNQASWQSSGGLDASRTLHDSGRINPQCDMRCDPHPHPRFITRRESHHLLPPELNRARFKILIWPVAYIRGPPAPIEGDPFSPQIQIIIEREREIKGASLEKKLGEEVEKSRSSWEIKIKILSNHLQLPLLIMICSFFISFTLSSIMYE